MHQYFALAEAAALIRSGASLAIAGAEAALDALPPGLWIGGTTPYLMTSTGPVIDNGTGVFVTDLGALGNVSFALAASDRLSELVTEAPAHGFSMVIMPSMSEAHRRFAADIGVWERASHRPLVGWVSGVHLQHAGQQVPKVYLGLHGHKLEDGAVVARVALPPQLRASVEVVDVFELEQGDVLRFDTASFVVHDCTVNGHRLNLARYLAARGRADGLLPMIRESAGRRANVAFRDVNPGLGAVTLFGPVLPGVDYHLAKPVVVRPGPPAAQAPQAERAAPVFSAHCIENFRYAVIEEQLMGERPGPVGFGQIAQQLLNQTTVSLRLVPVRLAGSAAAA